jgi:hypothetical protein
MGRHRRSRVTLLVPLLVAPLVVSVMGCRDEEPRTVAPPDELQTVDVAPPPDARVDPSRDVQERRRAESFSGVLPGDFPTGLPVPPSTSLVDQGPRWVELLISRPLASVRAQHLAQLRAAGWTVSDEGGRYRLRRGAATVAATFSAAGPSTRIRLEY